MTHHLWIIIEFSGTVRSNQSDIAWKSKNYRLKNLCKVGSIMELHRIGFFTRLLIVQPIRIKKIRIQSQQVMSLMSQVFIGSIFYEVTEGQLRDAFSPYGQIKGTVLNKCKVGWVFPMVIVSILHHAEFGPNDHRKGPSHYIFLCHRMVSITCKICFIELWKWLTWIWIQWQESIKVLLSYGTIFPKLPNLLSKSWVPWNHFQRI